MTEIVPKRCTLENGLKVVIHHQPGRRSVTNFLAIRSGSRYETAQNNGIAHFLEHLVFKGTEKYTDNEAVASAIEGVGGTLNAWTDFDHTAYWNVVPQEEWQVGVDLNVELAFKALLRQEDLERERGVIIEEIRMLQDDPARYVHDLSTEQMFSGHPLAQQIIGSEKTVQDMSLPQFKDYRSRYYAPSQAVFVVVGDLDEASVEAHLRQQFKSLEPRELTVPEPWQGQSKAAIRVLNKATDQTHFVLGLADDKLGLQSARERYAVMLLNTILGQGMSSRLFMNIREKKGLAYAIHSHFSSLEDAGALTVYGGVNTAKVELALQALMEELENLSSKLVPAAELERARRHLIGTQEIQADHGLNLAVWYGTDWLLGRWETHEEVRRGLLAVTSDEIQSLARRIFKPSCLTLVVIGPHEKTETFAGILNNR
ncbi:MAG: insulinase family protein [Candidatus Berkelbacteria bacterium]|nr:MAG: insulinase family protein [Candidatus Berkelbacteria bacterium]QQG51622.1 MAG: insulinase family protein [Candidatus Berkelbacteria bacterium]